MQLETEQYMTPERVDGIRDQARRLRRQYLKYKDAEENEMAKKEKREPVLLPDFSCHHLRHTFCTRFCENESNVKVIQAVMGHADIQTTMNIYAEVTEDKKRESIEHLSKNMKIFRKES